MESSTPANKCPHRMAIGNLGGESIRCVDCGEEIHFLKPDYKAELEFRKVKALEGICEELHKLNRDRRVAEEDQILRQNTPGGAHR